MDILHLVDRLEELFNQSKPIWFTHSVIVDEDRMLDLIDQMRVSIPEEIKKAQQIIIQRDRILAQTQEESSRTLNIAREKADVLIDRDPVIQAAQVRGEQIIQQARAEAEITRREADEYVLNTLSTVGEELERLLNQVRNGVRTLQSERQQAQTSQQPPK